MNQSPASPDESSGEFAFAKQAKKPSAKSILKQPVMIAAILLFIGVVVLVLYLEPAASSAAFLKSK